MSTLIDVLRKMEGQGTRDGKASAANIHANPSAGNDRINSNGKGNSLDAASSSTVSFGQGSFSFSSCSSDVGGTTSNDGNNNVNNNDSKGVNSNAFFYPNPGFPGLDKTFVKSPILNTSGMATANGNNASANSNPFNSSSPSTFRPLPNNVYHAPRKSAPLCETSRFQAPFAGTESSIRSSSTRPRFVKISRRTSNTSKGNVGASSGNLFSTGDGRSSSSVENSGYNPFTTNSAASSAELFPNYVAQDSNRGSGKDVFSKEINEVPSHRPKLSQLKDFGQQSKDLQNRINSWNPFVSTSDALKHKVGSTQIADESGCGEIGKCCNKPDLGEFTFRTNIEERIPGKENVFNVASGYAFRANPEEKLAAKDNVVNAATDFVFRANPEKKLGGNENAGNVTSAFAFSANLKKKLWGNENAGNVTNGFTEKKLWGNENAGTVTSGFTFRANPEKKLGGNENAGNVTSGFTFTANSGEKPAAKQNLGNSSFTVGANPGEKLMTNEDVANVATSWSFSTNRDEKLVAKENERKVGSGFIFRATTNENLAAKENAANGESGSILEANTDEKLEAKEDVGNVASGFTFRAKEDPGDEARGIFFRAKENACNWARLFTLKAEKNTGNGSKSTVEGMVDEVKFSGSLARDNGQQATEVLGMDSGAGDVCRHPINRAGQEGFIFSASKEKVNVDSKRLQTSHLTSPLHDMKSGGGVAFQNPFVGQSPISSSNGLKNMGGYMYDNPFSSGTPISGSKTEGSQVKSKYDLSEEGPVPSAFTFNMGERVESERNGGAKPCPTVEPFAFSAGTAGFPSAPLFPGGSANEGIYKAPPDIFNSGAGMGANTSSLEVSGPEDSSSERHSSWPSMESLSLTLNQMFEFNAQKGASRRYSTRKNREKSQLPAVMQRRLGRRSVSKSKRYLPSSTVDSMGHPVNHDEGGSPMDFSPSSETPPQNPFPFGSTLSDLGQHSGACGSPLRPVPFCHHDMADLGRSSVACDSFMKSGRDQVQHNLQDSLVMEAKVEELRAAAANLHIGADQDVNGVNISQEESSIKGEFWQQAGTNQGDSFNPNVCNTWERSPVEDEASAPVSENEWLNSRMEKVRIDDGENSTTAAKPDGNEQGHSFIFTGTPSRPFISTSKRPFISTSRRPSRRSHQLKSAENIGVSSSNMKFESSPFSSELFAQRCLSGSKGDLCQDKTTAKTCGTTSDVPNIVGSFSSLPKQTEEIGTPASPRALKSAAAEQACERWRLRGNQAYANGDFPKAEDYYSRGASSVSPNETSQSCVRASMLCYSNRAATRMAVGRMREALADCMRAMAIDPSFLRVKTRAASCHLALGENEAAVRIFKECLWSVKESDNQDLKMVTEVSEGLRKAQQAWEYTDRAAELLNEKNSGDATNALRIVNEALSMSPHSERLLELKALALFFLRKYEEVIQVCEQSLDSAERNACFVSDDVQMGREDVSGSQDRFSVKLWRWRMIAKAHFQLGRLEESLGLLLKYEEFSSAAEKFGKQSTESLVSLIATIRDLLRHKAAGNEAFQAGKHAEAVEHYTAALVCNGESRRFTAVCFCNRAAAFQALGNIADAIADCSHAIALDPNYPKAISRRATLHEMVRDYGQGCNDLRRLVILLEKQQLNKGNQLGRSGNTIANTQDLKQARERLIKAEEEMKRGNPLDHYLILGVEASSTAAEIKKAYRKAALRYHPDKAGQFLVRNDSGDDGLWTEVAEEVRRDAERLFKMIGEAYAILSDPSKRIRYDSEEDMRKLRTRGNSSAQTPSDAYRYQYEKGTRRQRDRWDPWNGYANLYQRWQSGPDAAQPDTYARRGSNNPKATDGSRWNDWDDF